MKYLFFLLVGLIICIPVLLFLPLNVRSKGKWTLLGMSFLASFLFLFAGEIMPVWQASLLVFLLIICTAMLMQKKAVSLFSVEREQDYSYLEVDDHEQEDALHSKEVSHNKDLSLEFEDFSAKELNSEEIPESEQRFENEEIHEAVEEKAADNPATDWFEDFENENSSDITDPEEIEYGKQEIEADNDLLDFLEEPEAESDKLQDSEETAETETEQMMDFDLEELIEREEAELDEVVKNEKVDQLENAFDFELEELINEHAVSLEKEETVSALGEEPEQNDWLEEIEDANTVEEHSAIADDSFKEKFAEESPDSKEELEDLTEQKAIEPAKETALEAAAEEADKAHSLPDEILETVYSQLLLMKHEQKEQEFVQGLSEITHSAVSHKDYFVFMQLYLEYLKEKGQTEEFEKAYGEAETKLKQYPYLMQQLNWFK